MSNSEAASALSLSIFNADVALMQKDCDIRAITADNDRLLAETEMRQMRSIMGCVAHDLKTPLQSFTSELEALKSILAIIVTHPSEDLEDIFQSLDSSVKFMLMQINRSQDYMKASSNLTLTPMLTTFSLHSSIAMAIKCIATLKTGRRIEFHPLTVGNDGLLIISDEQWMSENILCLLSNAVKYSVQGSMIDVRVMMHDRKPFCDEFCLNGRQFGSCTADGKFLCLSVEDCGVGISTELLANLFLPFNKVSFSLLLSFFETTINCFRFSYYSNFHKIKLMLKTQRTTGGTGIGLYSLSKRIEALNGTHGVGERKDGQQGSVFWFAIPYRPDFISDDANESIDLLVEPESVILVETEPATLRILVVDDSISKLNLVSRILKTNGHFVSTCENGALGLEAMKDAHSKGSIDLVLTDIQVIYLIY
jgi:signal transduction histidine kinase